MFINQPESYLKGRPELTGNIPKAKSKKEELNILKRKIIAFGNRLCFYACRIFPIDRNLISVCTFEGKGGFGCNAKPLVEELHQQEPELRFVWLVNDLSKDFPKYIRKVPNTLLGRAYWLSRSKVWIDNYRKPYGTVKRRGQYYLNVNHFTLGIKCTGLLRGDGFSRMAYLVNKNDSDMIDDIVIDSKWCEKLWDRAMVYEGHLLKTGAPRCDVLYGDRSKRQKAFREKHHLAEDAKVVMFAPTFREGARDGKRFVFSKSWSLDFKRLLTNLEQKFGGTWYLCVRVHPQLAPTFDDYSNPEVKDRIINESKADDMYGILAGMDAYITDYSSACFEAGLAGMPVFLYADDVAKYKTDRGQLYWDLNSSDRHNIESNKIITPNWNMKLPFSLATNNDELERDILGFDINAYKNQLDEFYNEIEMVFTGNASLKLTQEIIRKMRS